ncbi:MAG: cation:proton antiporter regulatory subunit [Acidimicrobiia bacterium]|nr:cation:proton antiporter regulatory subunit [Acidimicrobiia bacterium]MBT8216605.1 cation:proton antiporter regulatory subunit [Acidimicrobiia bacterium]NNF11528.1 cation:proton antiporter regulatory subunit [Acidimicrobiia bacterium]NNL69656.1 cation:proton antiporter regulatory subunit [Acidimicrobiia bacterium]
MTEIQEVQLPGVGVRLDFTTSLGERVGVVVHRGGRRELMVYDRDDPDRCSTVLQLSVEDAHTLNDILGGSRVAEVTTTVGQEIEGLAIDWLTLSGESGFAGKTIGDGMIRTRTGVSIVAVLRGETTFAAPGPSFTLEAGDTAVAVGTPPGIAEVRAILEA